MGGSNYQRFAKPVCEDKSLYSVARDGVVGIDASWFIHHHLRQYHGEIDEGNHSRAVLRTLEVAAKARKRSIEFYFVFNGAVPPCKLATVSARRKRLGFKRTWNLQRDIIAGLKHDGFCYTVAPYEAETQLVYMERCGMIQSVAACNADYFALGVRKLWWELHLNHNLSFLRYGSARDGGSYGVR